MQQNVYMLDVLSGLFRFPMQITSNKQTKTALFLLEFLVYILYIFKAIL